MGTQLNHNAAEVLLIAPPSTMLSTICTAIRQPVNLLYLVIHAAQTILISTIQLLNPDSESHISFGLCSISLFRRLQKDWSLAIDLLIHPIRCASSCCTEVHVYSTKHSPGLPSGAMYCLLFFQTNFSSTEVQQSDSDLQDT